VEPRVKLDVLVPTYNRAQPLENCIRSVLKAAPAPSIDVHVTVIANACTDSTDETLLRLQATSSEGSTTARKEETCGGSR